MNITVPTLLRIKPGALDRLGIYVARQGLSHVALFFGEGLAASLGPRVERTFASAAVALVHVGVGASNDIEDIFRESLRLPQKLDGIVAIGGGRVIDCCKYLALLRQVPLVSVPTLVSNDGFASPFSSLLVKGARRTTRTVIPDAVILDLDIVRDAPEAAHFSGIGDLFCKYTSVFDWKLANQRRNEPVNDFATSICQNAADAFFHYPHKDPGDFEFLRVIATSLLMSGLAMEIAQSSRPASGSEHLVSHAYDQIAQHPRLHGLQVGVASYAVSHAQRDTFELARRSVVESGFLAFVEKDPLSRRDFEQALRRAPFVKEDFYTILSEDGAIDEILAWMEHDDVMNRMLR